MSKYLDQFIAKYPDHYRRIVTERDPRIKSYETALGYFENEVHFLEASSRLRELERATGRSLMPNTLNDLHVIEDINGAGKSA